MKDVVEIVWVRTCVGQTPPLATVIRWGGDSNVLWVGLGFLMDTGRGNGSVGMGGLRKG